MKGDLLCIGPLRIYGSLHQKYTRILGIHFWSRGITLHAIVCSLSFAWRRGGW